MPAIDDAESPPLLGGDAIRTCEVASTHTVPFDASAQPVGHGARVEEPVGVVVDDEVDSAEGEPVIEAVAVGVVV